MRSIILFAPLFASVLFVQLGSGALTPLDALAGEYHGFSTRQIGLLGSAHFAGFFLGCLTTPALVARAGHARAFAAIAAIGVISTLLHPVFVNAEAWAALRVGAGFAVAGGYTVVESWLQAKLERANRGRVLSVYRVIDLTGAIGSQLLLIQLDPADYLSYNIVAMVGVISLLPLTLTKAAPPPSPRRPRLRPLFALMLSPLGAVGVIVVGLTNSSFRMVGPIYGSQFALTRVELAYFLAAAMLGGALAQPIAGWLADKFDRRWVLIGVSVAALAVCLTLSTGLATVDGETLIIGSFLFGAAAMPLYSISAAHANDFCPSDSVVELNASLLFMFALGATVSPALAAELIQQFGPDALWIYIAVAHVFLIVFGLWRMTMRPAAAERRPYRWLPRTSMIFGRLHKDRNGGENRDAAPDAAKDKTDAAG